MVGGRRENNEPPTPNIEHRKKGAGMKAKTRTTTRTRTR